MQSPIRARRVFLLTGYEPLPPEAHHHRFAREIGRFEKTWSVRAEVGALARHGGGPAASWPVVLSGPDWQTRTQVVLLAWDDVIAEDGALPLWKRLALYLAAAADILFSGAFLRYVRAYWRYGLFAAYPAVLLLLLALAAAAVGALWPLAGLPFAPLASPLLAVAALLALLRFPGGRLHMTYMMNDWIFARDMIRRQRPSIERRAGAFAEEIAAGVRAGDVDEVVVIAHSLGAVWMIEAVARALRAEAGLGRAGPPLSLVGVGSSTLKIALHPAAAWAREAVKTVADAQEILWAEYDSHVDFICFYKRDTVDALGLTTAGRPVRQSIRLSRMLKPETWGRFRGNLLRVHRQYVMGNEQRYAYDFHMIACGPFPCRAIVREGARLPGALGADGSLAGAQTPLASAGAEARP